MNFHKSICTEQGYSIMLTIILSLRIWFGKKLFIKVQEKNPCLFINSMKLNYLKKKKKKKIKEKKRLVRWLAWSELEAWSVLKGQT